MNGARHDFFARSALSRDDRRRVARRQHLDHPLHLAHRAALSDDAACGVCRSSRSLERPASAPLADVARRRLEQRVQHRVVERLREKIGGARLHGLDRGVDVPVRGHHHHRKPFVLPLDALEQLESRLSRQDDVAQHDVGAPAVELALALDGIPNGANVVTPILDAKRQHFAQRGFVVDDEDVKACRLHAT